MHLKFLECIHIKKLSLNKIDLSKIQLILATLVYIIPYKVA